MVDYYKLEITLSAGEYRTIPAYGKFIDIISVTGVNIEDIKIGFDEGELLPLPDVLPAEKSFNRIRIKNTGTATATVSLLIGLAVMKPLRQSVVLYKDLTGTKDIKVVDSSIAVPVDIQYSSIMVPVDIQGQAIDLVEIPKYTEDSITATGIDAETTVLDLDTRIYKNLGIALRNTGSNDLDFQIRGYRLYNGTIYKALVVWTTLSAGGTLQYDLDLSTYARVQVVAKASTSGSPSDILIEYILKS